MSFVDRCGECSEKGNYLEDTNDVYSECDGEMRMLEIKGGRKAPLKAVVVKIIDRAVERGIYQLPGICPTFRLSNSFTFSYHKAKSERVRKSISKSYDKEPFSTDMRGRNARAKEQHIPLIYTLYCSGSTIDSWFPLNVHRGMRQHSSVCRLRRASRRPSRKMTLSESCASRLMMRIRKHGGHG
jgi:hypothetical protein